MKEKLVITGASGLVGSYLLANLEFGFAPLISFCCLPFVV
jgi:thioester reductase-like protein